MAHAFANRSFWAAFADQELPGSQAVVIFTYSLSTLQVCVCLGR